MKAKDPLAGRKWWSAKLLQPLAKAMDEMAFRQAGLLTPAVRQGKIGPEGISATVRDSAVRLSAASFQVSLKLDPIEPKDWQRIFSEFGSRADLISPLLGGELSPKIEEAFQWLGLCLLPQTLADVHLHCTCGAEAPCRHQVAAGLWAAGELDRDPLALFLLRGLESGALNELLRGTPLGPVLLEAREEGPPEPEAATTAFARAQFLPPETWSVHSFWSGATPLPDLEPIPPLPITGVHVRLQGEHPPFWEGKESFVAVMNELYIKIRKELS